MRSSLRRLLSPTGSPSLRRPNTSNSAAGGGEMFTASEQPCLDQLEKAEVARVEAGGCDRGAFEAPRLDARAAQDRADFGQHARELPLRCARKRRERVVGHAGIVVILGRERLDQLLAKACPRFEVTHAPLVAEARKLRRL